MILYLNKIFMSFGFMLGLEHGIQLTSKSITNIYGTGVASGMNGAIITYGQVYFCSEMGKFCQGFLCLYYSRYK